MKRGKAIKRAREPFQDVYHFTKIVGIGSWSKYKDFGTDYLLGGPGLSLLYQISASLDDHPVDNIHLNNQTMRIIMYLIDRNLTSNG